MPDLTDYLRASNGLGEAVRCIVIEPRGIGDMAFNNTTPTNWNNYFVAMAGTVDPATDRFIEGQYVVFKGHLAGSVITIDEFAPGYDDAGNSEDDIIVVKPTTLWADIVADVMDGVEQATTDAEDAAADAITATSDANDAADAANSAAQGADILYGSGVPSSGLGYDGNLYIDTDTEDVYKKAAGSWTLITNIKGDPGNIANINAYTGKTTPVDADLVPIADSAASYDTKKLTFANLWTWIASKILANPTNSFLAAHPVGAIYMSVNSTNPGTTFGGTWSAWGTGRVPVGVDTGQSEFNTVEETGGDMTHSHGNGTYQTQSEIFTTGGRFYIDWVQTSAAGAYTANRRDSVSGSATTEANSETQDAGIKVGGNSSSTSSLQPYITCYMWKRTA